MSKSKKDEAVPYTPQEYELQKIQEFTRLYDEYRLVYEKHIIEHMNYALYGENWKEVLKTKKALEEFDKDLAELLNDET